MSLQETRAIPSFLEKHSPVLWQRLWSKNGDRNDSVCALVNHEWASVSNDRVRAICNLSLTRKQTVSPKCSNSLKPRAYFRYLNVSRIASWAVFAMRTVVELDELDVAG